MNLTRAIGTIVLCSWSAFAQTADPRQAAVPAPPFVVSSPTALSPAELLDTDKTIIRNLTANPIELTVTTTLSGRDIATPITDEISIKPIAPWGTTKIPNGTEPQSIVARNVIKGDTDAPLSLSLKVTGATFTDEAEIRVAYPTAAEATALLPEWNIRQVGNSLKNAIVPIVKVAAMSCQETPAGWLQGKGGGLQVIARPDPAVACTSNQIASGVDAVQLSLKAWPSGNPETGEYSGILTLPTSGETKAPLKLTIQNTWPLWAAAGCILAGVLVGLLYRWWSDVWSLTQRDRTAAARYRKESQEMAWHLNNTPGAGQRLVASFCTVVDAEYEDIDQKLKRESGLSRDPADSTAMAQRLAVFQSAPGEYEKLVQALDESERLEQANPLANKLGELITAWGASNKAPAITELGVQRALVESYTNFHPVWSAFEKIYDDAFNALQDVKNNFGHVLDGAMASAFAPLAVQVARDLSDTAVNLDQARQLLDSSEPTLEAASNIRSALTRATGALQRASIDLGRLPDTAAHLMSMAVNGVPYTPYTGPNFVPTFNLHRSVATGEANYRRQRNVLRWSNLGLALASLVLALLIGLNLLYWDKTFGVAEAWQAFAWGLGTKLGLDALYVLVDRLMRPTPTRTVLTTP